ncbi:Oxysterol-binding protein 3 [Taxawa tesnikishii (nom. ined.)]|nr:Oxysterol-binding protein 3 [Dothideales sp. JES 119]
MPASYATSRHFYFAHVLETTSSDEFFDAEDGGVRSSQLLTMSDDVDGGRDQEPSDDASETDDSESSSDAGDAMTVPGSPVKASDAFSSLFPSRPRSLSPLPLPSVQRRTTIPPPVQPPPSIIGFLRRNAGKDLSTVSMPVSANEPTSLLQKLAEPLEASALLDAAASLSAAAQATERLLHVAVFAIAGFAANRVKERAIRKPFNPMLGETYELVREDLGFRFVAEKVEHHPLRMAFQADGAGWSLGQTASPVQKFWGKSVELNTLGKTRLVLHDVQADLFPAQRDRGEKYVEPVASMTIICESSGAKAIATFKAGGMFAGRSEDVSIALYTPTSPAPLPLGLAGKWTSGLARTDTGASVWTPGPLVPDAAKCYGFTAFAAALNQVTGVEEGRLPPTDSRLRPDQRALEEGLLDKAEGLKARLEERQRARKKVLEGHGAKWSPTFLRR